MPKTSLGIQLSPSQALAVRVKSGLKGATVDRILRIERSVSGDATAEVAIPPPLPAAEVVASGLGADQAFHRQVELPFTDLRRLEQAAPLEAEESLPLPLESLVCHVQLLSKEKQRSRVLVIAAPTERVRGVLEGIRALGAEPQIVDVEALALASVARKCLAPDETALLVDVAPDLCQAVLMSRGAPVTFHAFSAGGADPELLNEVALYLGSREGTEWNPTAVYVSGPEALVIDLELWRDALARPVSQLPFPRRGVYLGGGATISWPVWAVPLGLALRGLAPRSASQVNLLRGPFGSARQATPWRRLAAVAAGCCAGLLALWGASAWSEASHREAQYEALKSEVRRTFKEALPDVQNIVSEVDQLRTRVVDLEERDRSFTALLDREISPLRLLKELSVKIPKEMDVELRDLVMEEGRILLEGATTSYRATEKIKADVTALNPRFTSVTSEARDGVKPGEVLFKLTISLRDKRQP